MANEKRLIYAEDALAAEFSIEADGAIGYVVDSEVIRWLPTVDAVEVVRCENCKYWDRWKTTSGIAYTGYCRFHNIDVMESVDFCSYGERRTDV